MPCFRCSERQTDPVRGSSPWHRVVISGEQVLVCPTCRPAPDWDAILDRCNRCASTRLAKALGTVLCRDCGERKEPDRHTPELTDVVPQHPPTHPSPQPQPQLAERPSSAGDPPSPLVPPLAAARDQPAAMGPSVGADASKRSEAAQDEAERPLAHSPGTGAPGSLPDRDGALAADVGAALARMFGRPRPVS
ncbi:hypothetical protein FrEUN1fDRAFT_5844 [Parafrankia sp. EUN1f]|nr:hypothetical protein FrEUN1fDRAFT_5844 [Parafrankia sp. EUN1f]